VAIKKLESYGRTWKHDAAGLRVVAEWSNDGLTYPGLNLTLDTLEGLTKRYWHYRPNEKLDHFNHDLQELPDCIKKIDKEKNLLLDKHNHIEGQIAAIADWIAFTATDIEDGLRSGWVTLDEVTQAFPKTKEILNGFAEDMRNHYAAPNAGRLQQDNKKRQEALNKKFANHIRDMLINDVVEQTNANTSRMFGQDSHGDSRYHYADDVRNMEQLVAGFSPEILKEMIEFQQFSVKVVHARMINQVGPVSEMVGIVIDDFVNGTLNLSDEWAQRRDAISNSDQDTPRAKGMLTELACEFLVRETTDGEVINYIKNAHPDFWQENFLNRHIPKAGGSHASRLNALQNPPALGGASR
jgi:dGTPase